MGLMNAIGLQPRNPTTSVTSQGTQTLALQLQNAETQTERESPEPGAATSGPGDGKSQVELKGNSTPPGCTLGGAPPTPCSWTRLAVPTEGHSGSGAYPALRSPGNAHSRLLTASRHAAPQLRSGLREADNKQPSYGRPLRALASGHPDQSLLDGGTPLLIRCPWVTAIWPQLGIPSSFSHLRQVPPSQPAARALPAGLTLLRAN